MANEIIIKEHNNEKNEWGHQKEGNEHNSWGGKSAFVHSITQRIERTQNAVIAEGSGICCK